MDFAQIETLETLAYLYVVFLGAVSIILAPYLLMLSIQYRAYRRKGFNRRLSFKLAEEYLK